MSGFTYEETLAELLDFVDERVGVIVSAPEDPTRWIGMICGTLQAGVDGDLSDYRGMTTGLPEGEAVMVWIGARQGGDDSSCFVLRQDDFESAHRGDEDALVIETGRARFAIISADKQEAFERSLEALPPVD